MCAKNIFIFFDTFFQSINPILDYTYDDYDLIQGQYKKLVEDLENSGNSDNDDDDDKINICQCLSCKITRQISLCFNDKNKSD